MARAPWRPQHVAHGGIADVFDRFKTVHVTIDGETSPPFVPKSTDSSNLAGRQNNMENGVQDRLGIKERAALLALMAEAKVVSNPDLRKRLGFALDGAPRRK
jgi:hypothetical protein